MKTRHRFLTDRDTRLLHYVFQNKVATAKQIHRDIFPSSSAQACYRRLRALVAFKLLQDTRSRYFPLAAFYPTLSAVKHLHEEGLVQTVKRPTAADIERLAHDIKLVDICSRFKLAPGCKTVIYENELKHESLPPAFMKEISRLGHIPDAILIMETDGKAMVIAVEYQRKFNDPKRWREKLQAYYSSDYIERVLIISEDKPTHSRLTKTDSEIRPNTPRKIYFATLAEYENSDQETCFRDSKGQEFRLPDAPCLKAV